MEQEKDNFWFYIGGLIVFVIALVCVFKNTHKEAIPEKAYTETSKEIDEQIAKAKQQQ
jgi:small neutral amino acid transporter SnatA (MarC family)